MKLKPEIKEDIKRFIRERLEEKQKEITITSPYSLSQEDIKEIIGYYPELESKKIRAIVDEKLIAGLIITQGTKVLDLSLKEKIKNLRKIVNETA